MDSLAFDTNRDSIEKKNLILSTFRTSKEQAKKSPKPIIRNLRLLEPDDELLKRLYIKDEGSQNYQDNKDQMETDYQIIGGEVEVNGVTFNLFFVLSEEEKIFTLDVIRNSNMTPEEKHEYIHREYLILFESYIIKCLEDLSKVDREVLEHIKETSNPDIIFKSKKTYDYYGLSNDKWAGYAVDGVSYGRKNNTNVNFYYFSTDDWTPIVHEFGHLFDYSRNITSDDKKDTWKRLSMKYSSALRITTRCGNYLSGYTKDDYEAKTEEFFADLFEAYYLGDRVKEGNYLIELLDKEALRELEGEIESTKLYAFELKLDHEYLWVLTPKIDEMCTYFGNNNDKELFDLINKFSDLTLFKIYNLDKNYVPSNNFNMLMYTIIAPMMKELIDLYEEYVNNPNVEDREIIKNKVLGYIEEIKNKSEIDENNNNKLDDMKAVVPEPENYSVENDHFISSRNKAEVLVRLTHITDIAFSPNYRFPAEFREEIFAKKDIVRQKVKELSEDGMTDIEFKVIIDAIKDIVDSMLNFNPVVYRANKIKKKLLKFHSELEKALKDNPENKTFTSFYYLVERAMEFFENESLLKKFNEESNIFLAIKSFDERLDQVIEEPTHRLRYEWYQDLEFFFDFVHESIDLDGYKRKY